jgi:hypothetical protein
LHDVVLFSLNAAKLQNSAVFADRFLLFCNHSGFAWFHFEVLFLHSAVLFVDFMMLFIDFTGLFIPFSSEFINSVPEFIAFHVFQDILRYF